MQNKVDVQLQIIDLFDTFTQFFCHYKQTCYAYKIHDIALYKSWPINREMFARVEKTHLDPLPSSLLLSRKNKIIKIKIERCSLILHLSLILSSQPHVGAELRHSWLKCYLWYHGRQRKTRISTLMYLINIATYIAKMTSINELLDRSHPK